VGDIDALFQLPPERFTAARNELAARLKAAGKTDEAARVKGLAKPPVSAWVVNQLFWRHRKPFDRLMAAGERLRKAQASQLRGKGGDLREPLEARRVALGDLSREAAALLRGTGHNASPDLMRRVTTTLEALATYANHPSAPRAGHLTADVDAPGFEALAALIPRQPAGAGLHDRGGEPPRVIPFARKQAAARAKNPRERKKQEEADRKARLAAATAAMQAAEKSLADARKAAARAEAALRKAAARAKEAERAKEAIGARYEKLTEEAGKAKQEARKVAAEAEEAAQAVDDAERALTEARETKQALGSRL
jgi:DNA repair exonuclease SbcCD ATPase subunit